MALSYRAEFAKYTVCNVLGMFGLSCYILADTFFIAQGLGADGLAALNLAIPIYSLIHGCGLLLGVGGGIRFAICRSQQEERAANSVFTHAFGLAALLAAAFLITGLFFSDRLPALLGADQVVYEMTRQYVQVLLLFAPAFLLNNLLLAFVRNDGAPRLAMLAMLGGSFSNILLDYLFIFPLQMGIFGAVLATGLAPILSLLILSPYFLRRQNRFHLAKGAVSPACLRTLVSLGFPSLFAELSGGIVMVVFNYILLGLQGNLGVAAYGVVANLSLVMMAIFTGIAQGAQPLLSRAYGQRDVAALRRGLRYGLLATLSLAFLLYLAVACLAHPIAALFNREQNRQLQAIAVSGLRLYFTGAAFAGCNILLATYFSATARALPAQAITLLRGLLLLVPVAFLLSGLWGLTGVWLALPLTELLVCALGTAMYLRGRASIP